MGTEHVKTDTQDRSVYRTVAPFSYLVAGGTQVAFTWTNLDSYSKRIIGTLFLKNFTVGRNITVTVEEWDGAAWGVIFTQTYPVAVGGLNPHFDVGSFQNVRVQMTIDIVELGNISVPLNIDVIRVAV